MLAKLLTVNLDQHGKDTVNEVDAVHMESCRKGALYLKDALELNRSGLSVHSDKASRTHIISMLDDIIGGELEDSFKARAWLSYCQGVLVCFGIVDADEMIDYMRECLCPLKEKDAS